MERLIDPALRAMMSDIVIWKKFRSEDPSGYGDTHQYYPEKIILCHIEWKTRVVRVVGGEEVISSAKVILDGAYGVTTKDQITMPDNEKPVIITVDRISDEVGPYQEVLNV